MRSGSSALLFVRRPYNYLGPLTRCNAQGMQIQSKRIEGVLGLVTMAYHVKKSTASLLPIAALVVTMAMFLSSCDATGNFVRLYLMQHACMQVLDFLA